MLQLTIIYIKIHNLKREEEAEQSESYIITCATVTPLKQERNDSHVV